MYVTTVMLITEQEMQPYVSLMSCSMKLMWSDCAFSKSITFLCVQNRFNTPIKKGIQCPFVLIVLVSIAFE